MLRFLGGTAEWGGACGVAGWCAGWGGGWVRSGWAGLCAGLWCADCDVSPARGAWKGLITGTLTSSDDAEVEDKVVERAIGGGLGRRRPRAPPGPAFIQELLLQRRDRGLRHSGEDDQSEEALPLPKTVQ